MFAQTEMRHDAADNRRFLSLSLSSALSDFRGVESAAESLGLTAYLNSGVRSLVIRLKIEPSSLPIEIYASQCLEAGMAFSSALLSQDIRHIFHCDGSGTIVFHLFFEQRPALQDAVAGICHALGDSFPHEYRLGEVALGPREIAEACQQCMEAFAQRAQPLRAAQAVPEAHARKMRPKVLAALRMIQRKAGSSDLSVGALAASVGLTPSHFCRIFLEDVGKSPLEFLTESRLDKAKRLLGDRGLRIHDVALSSGFENGEYFSRVFHRHVGLTPTQYRQAECGHHH